jgi:hypothetical protein
MQNMDALKSIHSSMRAETRRGALRAAARRSFVVLAPRRVQRSAVHGPSPSSIAEDWRPEHSTLPIGCCAARALRRVATPRRTA